jgi:hypothetical protein
MGPLERWRSARFVACCVTALSAGCLSGYAVSNGPADATTGASGGGGSGGTGGGGAAGEGGGAGGPAAGCAAGTGEPGSALWALGLGDLDEQALRTTVADSMGNVILAGVFKGSIPFAGGPTLTSAGLHDYFLVKLDCAGNHLWSLRLGDAGEQPNDVWLAVDQDDNLFLAGALDGTLDFAAGPLSATATDETNIFVAKFDADGTNLWSRRLEGSGTEVADDVAVDETGDVFLAGYFSGTIDFGGAGHVAEDADDLFVVKLSGATGDPVWSIDHGGPGNQSAHSVAVDSAGHVIVVGGFDGELTLDTTYQSAGGNSNNDAFIVLLDAQGTPIWSRAFGDDASQEANQVVVGQGDEIVVVGENEGSINPGGETFTSNDGGWAARYDTTGAHLFSRGFGGVRRLREVVLDGSGNVILGGNFLDPTEFGTSAGDLDLFVAKLSPDLATTRWSRTVGSEGLDSARGLGVDPYGNVLLGGWFRLTVSVGGTALTAAGVEADALIAKLAP